MADLVVTYCAMFYKAFYLILQGCIRLHSTQKTIRNSVVWLFIYISKIKLSFKIFFLILQNLSTLTISMNTFPYSITQPCSCLHVSYWSQSAQSPSHPPSLGQSVAPYASISQVSSKVNRIFFKFNSMWLHYYALVPLLLPLSSSPC